MLLFDETVSLAFDEFGKYDGAYKMEVVTQFSGNYTHRPFFCLIVGRFFYRPF